VRYYLTNKDQIPLLGILYIAGLDPLHLTNGKIDACRVLRRVEVGRWVGRYIHISQSHLFKMPFIFSKLLQEDASILLVLQTEVREIILFFF